MSQPPKTRSSRPASGTNSLILGDLLSVRLPRRIVPIWVSDPIGFARPLRIATTPAIVVVLTAPSPTSRIPSLPRAGEISTGVGTGKNYIIFGCGAVPAKDRSPRARCCDDDRQDGRSAAAG